MREPNPQGKRRPSEAASRLEAGKVHSTISQEQGRPRQGKAKRQGALHYLYINILVRSKAGQGRPRQSKVRQGKARQGGKVHSTISREQGKARPRPRLTN